MLFGGWRDDRQRIVSLSYNLIEELFIFSNTKVLLDGILSPGLGRDGQFPGTFPSEVHLTLVRSVLQTVFQFFC